MSYFQTQRKSNDLRARAQTSAKNHNRLLFKCIDINHFHKAHSVKHKEQHLTDKMAVHDSCVITTSFFCISLEHSSMSVSSMGERLRLQIGLHLLTHWDQLLWHQANLCKEHFFSYHLSELLFMWVNARVNAIKSGKRCVQSRVLCEQSNHLKVQCTCSRVLIWKPGWPGECNEYAESLGR